MSINAYREVETDKHEENTTCIAKKPGMYKWEGRRGVASFFVFIQLLILSPVTPPTVSLRSIQGKGCISLQKRLGCLRGTAGGFQGNGRVACVDFGKRLDAGSGTAAYRYSVRESFGYPPVMCGKKRGAHVQAD
ncbi:hypothetical protein GS460_03085 [Escherichia coli]|uniref:hypothetical protein n=1 Tax=Escherichia coli TaxID=562 RepID=UPI0011232424|nr:hypothetical protein [Escherichia coli]EFH2683758.1 hypothetical protein [Escherichia coli]